jgi:hypothetical protein
MTRPGDPLATVAAEVADLLSRIDHVLVHYGVCTDYPDHLRVLDGLRDFAALPGSVFTHIRDADPATLAGTIGPVNGLGESYQGSAGRLGVVVGGLYWGGPAREAFDGYWGPLVGYLDSGQPGRVSMVDTVTATAGYGNGVVTWWQGIRAAVVGFFKAAMENGIAVALAGVDTSAPLDLGSQLPTELPEIEGFSRVSVAATHGADLFLGAVGGAVRREPGVVPPGELVYRGGSGSVVPVSGRSWVRVGGRDAAGQDTVDG